MFDKAIFRGLLTAGVVASAVAARAVTIALVPVGNPGNAGELSGAGTGDYPEHICGAVTYTYNIGKYEVTASQYAECLNKVAGVDTYGLYNTAMSDSYYGSGITRGGEGTVGNPYTYAVDSAFSNRPVNCVSFWDACRFANWLHNGQPTGSQGIGTTETGAYNLTAAGTSNNTIVRNSDWKWAVTSEDEWYKAAYYDPNKPEGGGYWDYATRSDETPGWDLSERTNPGNNANYYYYARLPVDICTTVVGEFELSKSAYGTFDQNGNVYEWNETVITPTSRGMRGGCFGTDSDNLLASCRDYDNNPSYDWNSNYGFRVVASIPEPGSITLLFAEAVSTLAYVLRRRTRTT
jgi:formylglycine-generating enzyme